MKRVRCPGRAFATSPFPVLGLIMDILYHLHELDGHLIQLGTEPPPIALIIFVQYSQLVNVDNRASYMKGIRKEIFLLLQIDALVQEKTS